MKKAAVIIIGNEILLGRVTDTNSGFIARTLDPYGISVDTIVTVGDDGAAIAEGDGQPDIACIDGVLGPPYVGHEDEGFGTTGHG